MLAYKVFLLALSFLLLSSSIYGYTDLPTNTPTCRTVPQEVLERETIRPGRKSHLVQQKGNHDWRTAKNGFMVQAYAKNQVIISAAGRGDEVWDHHFVKLKSKQDMGNTQWLWLDRGGRCIIGIDYLDVTAGTVYRQK